MGMGFRCVIAPSFGDIFHNNCFQNGLLPVRLPEDLIRRMAEAMEGAPAMPASPSTWSDRWW